MSGGFFDNQDYLLDSFANDIEMFLENHSYSGETESLLKQTATTLRGMRIVLKHIDYLFSDDYGEESFKAALNKKMSEFVKRQGWNHEEKFNVPFQ